MACTYPQKTGTLIFFACMYPLRKLEVCYYACMYTLTKLEVCYFGIMYTLRKLEVCYYCRHLSSQKTESQLFCMYPLGKLEFCYFACMYPHTTGGLLFCIHVFSENLRYVIFYFVYTVGKQPIMFVLGTDCLEGLEICIHIKFCRVEIEMELLTAPNNCQGFPLHL